MVCIIQYAISHRQISLWASQRWDVMMQ